ncbi:hypothetical protein BKA70DRAFT_1444060 [Coprinopsis sp. MPI-PUGE-AT-0042]|nr:hypothetical protein BKA70DRAFT_1444060 [Coprinopsis sp. MPI-PUGE-AT-0042]
MTLAQRGGGGMARLETLCAGVHCESDIRSTQIIIALTRDSLKHLHLSIGRRVSNHIPSLNLSGLSNLQSLTFNCPISNVNPQRWSFEGIKNVSRILRSLSPGGSLTHIQLQFTFHHVKRQGNDLPGMIVNQAWRELATHILRIDDGRSHRPLNLAINLNVPYLPKVLYQDLEEVLKQKLCAILPLEKDEKSTKLNPTPISIHNSIISPRLESEILDPRDRRVQVRSSDKRFRLVNGTIDGSPSTPDVLLHGLHDRLDLARLHSDTGTGATENSGPSLG